MEIAEVNWAGLRCRVRVEAAQPGLSVDLRTKVNDAGSSVSHERVLDAKGAASLLVTDDELEGAPAVVVVVDASGLVIAKQPTIIGGDDLKAELDSLDRLAARAFEGYLVRKDLVRKYSRQYPVPTYVVEFLLGRYCASTDEQEIEEGPDHRRAAAGRPHGETRRRGAVQGSGTRSGIHQTDRHRPRSARCENRLIRRRATEPCHQGCAHR